MNKAVDFCDEDDLVKNAQLSYEIHLLFAVFGFSFHNLEKNRAVDFVKRTFRYSQGCHFMIISLSAVGFLQ